MPKFLCNMSDLCDESNNVSVAAGTMVPLAPNLDEVSNVVGNSAVADNGMPIVSMLSVMKISTISTSPCNEVSMVSQVASQPEAMPTKLSDPLCATSQSIATSNSCGPVFGDGTENCAVRPLGSSSPSGETSAFVATAGFFQFGAGSSGLPSSKEKKVIAGGSFTRIGETTSQDTGGFSQACTDGKSVGFADATLGGGGLIAPTLDAEYIDYSKNKRYVKAKVGGFGPFGANATSSQLSAFPSISDMLKIESKTFTPPLRDSTVAAAVDDTCGNPERMTNEPRSSTMIPVKKVDIPEYLHNSEYYRAFQGEEEDEVILIPSDCMKSDDTVTNDADLRSLLLTLRFWVAGCIFDSILKYTNFPSRSTEFTLSEFYPDFPVLQYLTSLDRTKRPVVTAIKSGDLEYVQYFLERGHTWPKESCDLAAQTGRADMLTFALRAGCEASPYTCVLAAARGHLSCLRVLHVNGVGWDNTTLTVAAEKGHLNCLQYAHEQGQPLTANLYALAVASHNFAMVKYLHANDCDWDGTNACKAAAGSGNKDILKFLHENGCPWDVTVCQKAAEKRQLTIVLYLLRNGCSPSDNIWDFTGAAFQLILDCFLEMGLSWSATPSAIQHVYDASCGDVASLQLMHENGCPWNATMCKTAANRRQIDAVLYMLRYGCVPSDNIWDFKGDDFHRILECFLEAGWPWSATPGAMLQVIKSNNLEGLKGLVESGCPWHLTTTARIVYYVENMEMLEYVHAKGCPWSEDTCAHANSIEFLTFAHTHGALIDSNTCALLLDASQFSLECFKYAHEHGSCLTSACMDFALQWGKKEMQKYLREHSCPSSVPYETIDLMSSAHLLSGPPKRRILTVKKKKVA